MADIKDSAVALIETPEMYILQRRPNLPGQLAYPGMLQFFGGQRMKDELPGDTIRRELTEETDINLNDTKIYPLWGGPVKGSDKVGAPITRHVSLFRVYARAVINCLEQGEVVPLPKFIEVIQDHEAELTPFAFMALKADLSTKQIMGV